jgi:ribose transport system permease protein
MYEKAALYSKIFSKVFSFLKKQVLLIVLILLIFIGWVTSDSFLTITNLLNILRQISVFGIISIGLTFVLISGNVDLSIGSIVSLTSVSIISFISTGNNYPLLGVIVTLIIGILLGLGTGFVVGRLGVNSVLATIAMMLFIQGLAMLYTRGYVVFADKESAMLFVGRGYFLNIPVPIIIFTFIILVSYIILGKTTLGKRIYATGGGEEVARLCGIKTTLIKILVFIISGFCCAIAGIILSTRLGSGHPEGGAIYLTDSLIAVILGGTSLYGGKGGVINTLFGVLIIGVLGNLFIFLGLEYYFQLFSKGLILIFAVWFDINSRRQE